MPYKLRKKKNGKWEVVNSNTGESKGESKDRVMAIAHMRALYKAKGKW